MGAHPWTIGISVRRITTSVALTVAALLLLLAPAASASAAPALTPTLGGWVPAGASTPFSFELAGVTWSDAIVRIELADGTMSVDTTGLALTLQPGSASFSSVTEIAFTGSLADVTTALADRLSWTAPATPSESYLHLTISVDSWIDGLSLNPANNHLYQLSAGPLAWDQARDAAAALIHDGQQGYLATVTSAVEDNFVNGTAIGGTTAWIAATTEIAYVNPYRAPADQFASNSAIAGNPHWGAGPEAGLQAPYVPWFPGEPNGTATDRCILVNWFSPGAGWNDSPCSVGYRYVVEFGGITASIAPLSFDNLGDPGPARAAASLPTTGVEAAPAALAAALALVAGAALVLRARRTRRRAS
jgi:LPXTG-motif cell wall-anchored protein